MAWANSGSASWPRGRGCRMQMAGSGARPDAWGDLFRCLAGEEAAGLARPKLGIEAAPLQELVMGALLDNAALVHDDEAVHGGDGGQAMGDGDDGLAFHE